jgi:hypothetical protein
MVMRYVSGLLSEYQDEKDSCFAFLYKCQKKKKSTD